MRGELDAFLLNHGVTAYLKSGGTLEKAARMANHASTRTTQLYDRRAEEVTLDEVERVVI
jgi:sugar/nucleoside kinase (ribokinase family)